MKKYIALAILATTLVAPSFGQQFVYQSNAPFGIMTKLQDSSRTAQSIFFQDYDHDGDLDLFLTGLDYIDNVPKPKWSNIHFFIQVQENIGDKTHPQFSSREDVFTPFPYPVGYLFADGGDLNHDGKMDIITAANIDYIGNEKVRMMINTGIPGAGQFQITSMDAFGLDDYVPESLYVPHLVDLDGDGDLDLMTSGFNSAYAMEDGPNVAMFKYARNAGTINTPIFEGWYPNPYDLVPNPNGEILTSGDIDNDGDVDLIGSLINIPADSQSYLYVHLHTTGTDGYPTFGTVLESPYGMPSATGEQQLLFPSLVDLDGDHDLDLFVFGGTSLSQSLRYYENTLCETTIDDIPITICDGESVFIGGVEYSNPGEYNIHLESTHQCDSIIHLTLTVLSIPTVSLNASICDGDSYFVGGESFSNPGNYTILVPASNGCDTIVLLDLTVYIVDPSVTVNGHTLTASQNNATYQWFNCDLGQNIAGETNQSFTATATGTYQVYVTDEHGCTVQSMCLPIVITGIHDDAYDHSITVYPNPAHGTIYLKNHTAFEITTLTLTNLAGQVLGQFHPDNKNSIDVSALPPGMYFLKAKMNGREICKKVILM